jgi:hypothetical protein
VRNIVDLIWESQRLRRLKASLLEGDRGFPTLSPKDSHSGLAIQ